MITFKEAQKELRKLKNPQKANFLMRFFKTGVGEYAEGDQLLGITVPETRAVAVKFTGMSLDDAFKLLKSKMHEERLMAIFILVAKFGKGSAAEQKKIAEGYLDNIAKYVNNWDLVDSSANYILGPYLTDKPRDILYELAKSENLWEKRVAMISTYHFIKNNEFDDALKIAEILLYDSHDLIHKAVGWMLREIGNRNEEIEIAFLDKFAPKMPRTALRYAIEKFSPSVRTQYLKMKSK